MHAASVDPEPGSNSPKELHSLTAATSSEGLTARTFKLLDLCHSSVVKVQTASGARDGAPGADRQVSGRRGTVSNGPRTGADRAAGTPQNALVSRSSRMRAPAIHASSASWGEAGAPMMPTTMT